jgi:GTP-binding protein EngB required for normal cell division
MTTVAHDPPFDAATDGLRRSLVRLVEAADAADVLGIPTERVRAAHDDATRRLGFPSDAYVLAFVGGTGVGKSSLLNALAGSIVSAASVRRPTTSDPIAWVPASERPGLEPVLEWLEVEAVAEHGADGLGPVAILDLPDMDSVTAAHRARVEALLPRVDAVVWVTDLEKYADAVLHDDFLRTWVPRLERQAVVVNKVDRLTSADRPRVRRDLEADLSRRLPGDGRSVPVLLTSALSTADLEELRAWLADGASAKAIARGRIRATVADLAKALAHDAGLEPGRAVEPFLSGAERAAAIDAASEGVLRAVDLEGLQRQAVAATRARARARGAGPLGGLTSLAYRMSGRETKVASPTGYLMRWRDRGPLTPAVEALRRALGSSLTAASPMVRPKLAAALEPAPLRKGLERAVGQAVASIGRLEAPTSRWWSLLGLLQTLATLAIALSVAWVVLWVLTRPPVETVDLPILGDVPMPFVALVVTLFVGYVLARVLGLHAGWVGRRWARRVRDRVIAAVRDEVTERGLAPLDALEDARRRLAAAVSAILGGP